MYSSGAPLPTDSFTSHEQVQFIMWGVVADWFLLIGRYKSLSKSHWLNIHPIAMVLVTVVSLVYRKNHFKYRKEVPDFSLQWLISVHKLFGLPALLLNFGVNLLGFIIRLMLTWNSQLKYHRLMTISNFRRFHLIGGVSLWVNLRISLLTGSFVYSSTFGWTMFLMVLLETVVFLSCCVYLEKRYRASFEKGRMILSATDRVKYEEDASQVLAAFANKALTSHQMAAMFKGKTAFQFLNKVYLLDSGFVHPGGRWVFEQANFRDVTRYLFGVTGLDPHADDQKWTHSAAAFEQLAHACIGSVDLKTPNHWNLRDASDKPVSSSDLWKLAESQQLSRSTSLFKFRHARFRLKLGLQGTGWMGRYFVVHGKLGVQRLYTNCSSLAPEVLQYLAQLKQFFAEGRDSANSAALACPELPSHLDYLPLAVKMYDRPGALSKELHATSPNETVLIEGPFGRGFEFDDGFKGDLVIVAGGTGILPFVDLLAALYVKALVLAASPAFLKASKAASELHQKYATLLDGATVKLLATFNTLEDFFLAGTVTDLYQLCQQHQLDFFDCEVRLGDRKNILLPTTEQKYTAEYLGFHVKRNTELVVVCGPPEMNKAVYQALVEQEGYPKERLVFQ